MRLRDRSLSVTALGWLGALGTVVLVAASRLDLLVVAIATPFLAFFVLAALLSSPTHRADLERRRSTLRASRRLIALLEEFSALDDADTVAERVAAGLVDVLQLQGCWFEAGETVRGVPEMSRDGYVPARVQRRVGGGLALPPLVAMPVQGPEGPIGRFMLEADESVGLSPERRHVAVAMAQLVAVARPARGRGRAMESLSPPSG
jgi:hypothetical protein